MNEKNLNCIIHKEKKILFIRIDKNKEESKIHALKCEKCICEEIFNSNEKSLICISEIL